MILENTAKVTNGLCGFCKKDHDSRESKKRIQNAVDQWRKNPETLPGTNGIPYPENFALSFAASQLKSELFPTEEDIMEKVCHEFFDKAHGKWSTFGGLFLSKKEKYTLAIETFYGEVLNGGLLQYLGNESGNFANWSVDAFNEIDIPEISEAMKTVLTLFPKNKIPKNASKRWDILEEIDDKIFDKLEKPFWKRYNQDETEIRKKLYNYLTK